jgi:hypothetical protein
MKSDLKSCHGSRLLAEELSAVLSLYLGAEDPDLVGLPGLEPGTKAL